MMISRAKRKRMISVEDEGSEQKARLGGGSSPRVGLGSPGVTFTSGGGAGGILGAAGAAGAAGAGGGAPGSESKTGKRVLAVVAVGACLEKGGDTCDPHHAQCQQSNQTPPHPMPAFPPPSLARDASTSLRSRHAASRPGLPEPPSRHDPLLVGVLIRGTAGPVPARRIVRQGAFAQRGSLCGRQGCMPHGCHRSRSPRQVLPRHSPGRVPSQVGMYPTRGRRHRRSREPTAVLFEQTARGSAVPPVPRRVSSPGAFLRLPHRRAFERRG